MNRWPLLLLGSGLIFAIGAIVGSAFTLALWEPARAQVNVLEGYVTAVNASGTAIGVSQQPGGPGEGYTIGEAWWRESGSPWERSTSTCLEPLSSGQRVRLGVVQVEPEGETPGGPVVAWVECLDS